jgi:hypothetical protein
MDDRQGSFEFPGPLPEAQAKPRRARKPKPVPTQEEELERVSHRIEGAVHEFCRERLARAEDLFHMEDLLRYVNDVPEIKVAPASPDRVLRAMRAKGVVNYTVVERSKSLYRVTAA